MLINHLLERRNNNYFEPFKYSEKCIIYDYYSATKSNGTIIIINNPWRSCAVRVTTDLYTVVVLRVCVCVVCPSAHAILAVHVIKSIMKDTVVLSVKFTAILIRFCFIIIS